MNNAYQIKLLSKTYVTDDIGNRLENTIERVVFANVVSISAKEFFDGGQNGLKPDKKFIIRQFEYNAEDSLILNDEIYSVYRSYSRDDGFVELYTEKKVGLH